VLVCRWRWRCVVGKVFCTSRRWEVECEVDGTRTFLLSLGDATFCAKPERDSTCLAASLQCSSRPQRHDIVQYPLRIRLAVQGSHTERASLPRPSSARRYGSRYRNFGRCFTAGCLTSLSTYSLGLQFCMQNIAVRAKRDMRGGCRPRRNSRLVLTTRPTVLLWKEW